MLRWPIAIRAWLPVIVWMTAIFIGSTDALSSGRTSRFLGPLLRWVYPAISEDGVRRAQYVVRKAGHLTEYAILAVLCQRALQLGSGAWPSRDRRHARLAFALAVAYAATDELHQAFVATRFGTPWDVVIDSMGALLGLLGVWLWLRSHALRANMAAALAANPARDRAQGSGV